ATAGAGRKAGVGGELSNTTAYYASDSSATGGDGGHALGGGMYVSTNTLGYIQIGNVNVTGNTLTAGDGGDGGDVYWGATSSAAAGDGGDGGHAYGAGIFGTSSASPVGPFSFGSNTVDNYTQINGGPTVTGNTIIAVGSAGAGGTTFNHSGTVMPGSAGAVGSDGVSVTSAIQEAQLPSTYTAIGDLAWKDVNADNDYDAGTDIVLPNVLVTMYDDNVQIISRMYTDASGLYGFNTGFTGSVILKFAMGTASAVTADQGGDDELDSDIGGTGGITITINGGVDDFTNDAGFVDGDPNVSSLTLIINGTVSSGVTSVSIGSVSVVPSGDAYTISISVPANSTYVDMVSADDDGNQSTRRINIAALLMGGG
ncbi:MAG: hypothetical protein HRU15_10725, partial [Planctomycetes bacterium]|nr:hypothetical protein [Planctomycetota bacterium]